MKVLGWLIAYWGIWVTLGSFLLMIRFPGWVEEWRVIRSYPTYERLKLTYAYLCAVTLWPREYKDQELIESLNEDEFDDEDDDDEPGDGAPVQAWQE